MKNLIYILFVILMLVLAFIIMNSVNPKNTIYSDYSMYLNEGVNFSNIKTQGYTGNSKSLSNNYSASGLIPGTLNNTSVLNNSYYKSTGNFINSGESSVDATGYKSITNDNTSANKTSAGPNKSSLKKNNEKSSDGGIVGNIQMPFSTGRKSTAGNQKISSGLIASTSIGGNTGLISAPADPYIDYNEDDITHPGGDPMGQPIPVGNGALPFLLFVGCYLLHMYTKKNRNIF